MNRRPQIIRKARSAEDFYKVCRLRYDVYVAEMHRNVGSQIICHHNKVLADYLDPFSHTFFAETEGQIVGSLRITLRAEASFPHEDLYVSNWIERKFGGSTALVTKLMVKPEHRRSRIFRELVREGFRFILENEATSTIIDCNDHLVSVFSRLGFRQYRPDYQHEEYGNVHAMVLDNYDSDHLEACRSPLRNVLAEHLQAQETTETAQKMEAIQ